MSRKELFNQLVQSEAFKELERVVETEILNSIERADSINSKDFDKGMAFEERGFRKGLRFILKEAHYQAR